MNQVPFSLFVDMITNAEAVFVNDLLCHVPVDYDNDSIVFTREEDGLNYEYVVANDIHDIYFELTHLDGLVFRIKEDDKEKFTIQPLIPVHRENVFPLLIDFDSWLNTYKPLNKNTGLPYDGGDFSLVDYLIDGPTLASLDLNEVRGSVWTYRTDHKDYIESGIGFVNVLGYFVTKNPPELHTLVYFMEEEIQEDEELEAENMN